MNWTCEQSEAHLNEYLEHSLPAAEQQAFDEHASGCERCMQLLAEVSQLVVSLHALQELPVPPELQRSILEKTSRLRQDSTTLGPVAAWLRSFGAARFLLGSLSVAATLVMMFTLSGFSWTHPQWADLLPENVYRNFDRQAHLLYARGSKFVNDLQVVYEIQSSLRPDTDTSDNPDATLPPSQEKQTTPPPGQTKNAPPAPKDQQNRVNEYSRAPRYLADAFPEHRVRRNILGAGFRNHRLVRSFA